MRKRANEGEPHEYEQQPENTSEKTGDQSANKGKQDANQKQDQQDVHDDVSLILMVLPRASKWVLGLFDEDVRMPEEFVDIIEVRQLGPVNRRNFRHQCFRTTLHHSLSDCGKTFWHEGERHVFSPIISGYNNTVPKVWSK
jgi:hypothetical protein